MAEKQIAKKAVPEQLPGGGTYTVGLGFLQNPNAANAPALAQEKTQSPKEQGFFAAAESKKKSKEQPNEHGKA